MVGVIGNGFLRKVHLVAWVLTCVFDGWSLFRSLHWGWTFGLSLGLNVICILFFLVSFLVFDGCGHLSKSLYWG